MTSEDRPFDIKKVDYGWIVVNADGSLAEPLTPLNRVKHYRTRSAALKKAKKLTRETPK